MSSRWETIELGSEEKRKKREILDHIANNEYIATPETLMFYLYEGFDGQTSVKEFMKKYGVYDEEYIKQMLNGLSINYPDFINYSDTLGLDVITLKKSKSEKRDYYTIKIVDENGDLYDQKTVLASKNEIKDKYGDKVSSIKKETKKSRLEAAESLVGDEEIIKNSIWDKIKGFFIKGFNSSQQKELSMDEEPKEWITVKGNHIPVFNGENTKTALTNFFKEKSTNSPFEKIKNNDLKKFFSKKEKWNYSYGKSSFYERNSKKITLSKEDLDKAAVIHEKAHAIDLENGNLSKGLKEIAQQEIYNASWFKKVYEKNKNKLLDFDKYKSINPPVDMDKKETTNEFFAFYLISKELGEIYDDDIFIAKNIFSHIFGVTDDLSKENTHSIEYMQASQEIRDSEIFADLASLLEVYKEQYDLLKTMIPKTIDKFEEIIKK